MSKKPSCNSCVKRGTMECPNSSECYALADKPHYAERLKRTTAFYGVEWLILQERTNWRGKIKNVFRRFWWKICRRYNAKQLEFICNLHPNYKGGLTSDQAATLNAVAEYAKADPFIVKNGKMVYRIPRIEDVTLWQVIEARRSETATEKVTKWCTPKEHEPAEYAPDNVYHLLCATKYIKEQIETADGLEKRLFPFDAGSTPEDDPIKEAKNVLTLVQATAELFACTFEEAKQINYLDAMLALSKRHEENEKQKAEMKKHYKS